MKQKLLNKLWLRVGMIVAIMTTALSGTVKADTESVTFSSQGYSNGEVVSSYTGTKLNITFTDGSTATAYYSTGTGIRLYGGGSATFSVNNATITNVALTFSGDSNAPGDTNVWSCTGGSGSGTSGASATWTGSAESVTIARATGSGHWRLQVVTVTYTTSGGGGGDTPTPSDGTGTINFGSAAGCTAINAASVTGNDDLGNTWTITTEGTTSFTANTAYYQVGSGSKPATSITFTTTLASELNITAMSAKFGGFSGTAGTVTLKVGDTTVGTGSLNASSDVTVNSTSAATGTVLTVTVTGIAKGVKCYYISYTCTSSTDPTCETPTFSPAAGTYTSAQNVTISTATEGATIYYTTDGTDPTTSSTQYNGAINVSSTTTIKAIAAAEDHNNSPVASATYTIVPLEHAGTQADPYTVADAFTAIDANAGVTGVYVSGIVCQASANLYSSKYLSYYISDDGTTTNKLEAYNGLGIGGANFTSVDDIQEGDKVVIYGNLTKHSSTYEFAADNQLVSIVHPASITVASTAIDVPAAGEDDVIDVTYDNITSVAAEVKFFEADGVTPATYDWIIADINNDNDIEYIVDANTGAARTAYMKVYAVGNEGDAYSELITITQAAPAAPATGDQYALFTGNLVEGDYIICYDNGAMKNTVSSDRIQYEEVTPENDVITTDNASIVWHIAPSDEYWTIYSAEADAYAASTGAKNKAQMLADGTDDKALWTVSGTETYEFVNKKNSANNVNANLRKNGTYGFACYATSTGGALSLYKKVVPTESVTVTNAGYATFASTNALDFTGKDIKAYIATANGTEGVNFTQINKVPANTGVLLVGTEGQIVNAEVPRLTGNADATTGNVFVPGTGAAVASEGTDVKNYVLSSTTTYGVGFYPASGKTVAVGKAYISVPSTTPTPVKGFIMLPDLDDDATGISLTPALSEGEGEIYNLAGQRLNKMQKGINIVNGKKILK